MPTHGCCIMLCFRVSFLDAVSWWLLQSSFRALVTLSRCKLGLCALKRFISKLCLPWNALVVGMSNVSGLLG